MKFEIKDKKIAATAETAADNEALLALMQSYLTISDEPVKTTEKRSYARKCPECEKSFTSRVGLGIHRNKAHGVQGKNAEYKKQYHEKNKNPDNEPKKEYLVNDEPIGAVFRSLQ